MWGYQMQFNGYNDRGENGIFVPCRYEDRYGKPQLGARIEIARHVSFEDLTPKRHNIN